MQDLFGKIHANFDIIGLQILSLVYLLKFFLIFSLQDRPTIFNRHFASLFVHGDNMDKFPVLNDHSTVIGCFEYFTEGGGGRAG